MITIRKANPQDLNAIQKLNHQIMVNNQKYDPCIIPDFDLTDVGKGFFNKALENPKGLFYIAMDGNKMIGYINGGLKKYVYHRKKFFEIENLGVIPKYKRQKIATKLYQHLFKQIKKLGYQRIYLNCYSKNKEALAFYKKLEFKEIDVSLEKDI